MHLLLLSNPSRRITEKIRNRLVQRSSAGLKIVEGSKPHATTVPLFQIPLELVYEILWYLGPNDLLNLSRTNKLFRAFLRCESCDVYWKVALAAYPYIPQIPPSMALLSYAGLVTETYCQNCLSDAVCRVHWIPLVRLCEGCFKTMFPNGIDEACFKKGGHYHVGDRDLKSRLRAFSHREERLALSKWSRLSSSNQDRHVEMNEKHSRWFGDHCCNKENERSREITRRENEMRHRKFERIVAYLEHVGYTQLDVYPYIHEYSEYQAQSRYTKEIKEEWDDVKPDIIKFAEDCAAFMDRFTRLESILRDMDTELPGVADHNYVDIALLPEVDKVLSVRYDQEISEAEWANLRQVIPAAFLRWRKDVDRRVEPFVFLNWLMCTEVWVHFILLQLYSGASSVVAWG